ncbi:MAG: acyltransferase [Planctomycetota bacterium]|nr:acyltransferase [Planctomycetota bacterium]
MPETNVNRPRYPALDGVRGLAIILVLIHHQTLLANTGPLSSFMRGVAAYGWCGVDLFFVLSGFLITGILLDSKNSPQYFKHFYTRRVLRIFPLYYLILCVCVFILPYIPHPKSQLFGRIAGDEIWYFFFLQNYVIAWHGQFRHGILDVTWSLAIEEQFYIIWPMIVAFFRPEKVLLICIALIIGVLVLRILIDYNCDISPVAIYVSTLTRMDGLACGALIAVAVRIAKWERWLIDYRRVVLVVASISLLFLTAGLGKRSWESSIVIRYGYTCNALLFGSLIVELLYAKTDSLLYRLFVNRFLIAFGKYSYAIYLINLPLAALIRDTVYGPKRFLTIGGSQLPGQFIYYVICTSLIFTAAVISWNLIEKRFLAIGKVTVHTPASNEGVGFPAK